MKKYLLIGLGLIALLTIIAIIKNNYIQLKEFIQNSDKMLIAQPIPYWSEYDSDDDTELV